MVCGHSHKSGLAIPQHYKGIFFVHGVRKKGCENKNPSLKRFFFVGTKAVSETHPSIHFLIDLSVLKQNRPALEARGRPAGRLKKNRPAMRATSGASHNPARILYGVESSSTEKMTDLFPGVLQKFKFFTFWGHEGGDRHTVLRAVELSFQRRFPGA